MEEDIHNRYSKDKIINVIIEATKPKIEEVAKIRTFNRLIDDANRRILKNEKIREMKAKVDKVNQVEKIVSPKNKNEKDWEKTYNERFKKFETSKVKKIKQKKKQQIIQQKESEDKILASPRLNKKASQNHIQEYGKKLFEDAEKRRVNIDKLRIQRDEAEMTNLSPNPQRKYENFKKKHDFIYNSPIASKIVSPSYVSKSFMRKPSNKNLNSSKSSDKLIKAKHNRIKCAYMFNFDDLSRTEDLKESNIASPSKGKN
jgi:hypothetical protein